MALTLLNFNIYSLCLKKLSMKESQLRKINFAIYDRKSS